MKRAFFLPLLLLSLTTSPSRADEPEGVLERAPLVLGQGEQRLLRVPGLARYSLGSDCVRVHAPRTATTDTLLLKAIRPGHADLWVFKRDGSSEYRSLRVEKVPPGELPPGLAQGLSRLAEAEVLLTGTGAVLRGELGSLREAARVRALAEAFPKAVRDETEPSETLASQALERLREWIRATPLASNLRAERQGRLVSVRGSLEREALRAATEKRIRLLAPFAAVELEALPDGSPTVHFRVFLLELKKNRVRSLGLSWPAMQEGAFRVTTAGVPAIRDALSLDVALQALEGEGSLRVLSNPELVVRAPGAAELFAGGELPIRARTPYSSNVTWKNYGLTLRLKVTHSAGDRVRLDIFTEVSHLDAAIAQGEIPGIQANRMNTQVDARYGVPLLLSGLLQEGTREQARGLPVLRSIPILGKLFGSEDYLNERSELVAILLPSSAPPSPGLSMNRLLRAWDRDEPGRALPRGPIPPARHWLPPDEERRLRASPDWPWNALDADGDGHPRAGR